MPLNLAEYFKKFRLERGLKYGQLALQLGSSNPSKVGAKIRDFEHYGSISKELLKKLMIEFQCDSEIIKELIRKDEKEGLVEWGKWADEPIKPYVLIRYMPAVWGYKDVPEGIKTLEDAEAWVLSLIDLKGAKKCLVWSRRMSVWIQDERRYRSETVPGKPNEPSMRIGGRNCLFNFGNGVKVEDI